MSENVRERRSVEGGQCEDLRTCDHDAITKDKQAYNELQAYCAHRI